MTHPGTHPEWCAGDVTAEFDGTDHVSPVRRWRPAYDHEVAVVHELHQVVYPDGGAETPAAIVHIDNPANPGEIAMTADDVIAFVGHLSSLREALDPESGDSRR